MGVSLAVVGATGAVGHTMRDVLEERDFPVERIQFLASRRSAGKTLLFRGEEYAVEELAESSFDGVDIALFSIPKGESLHFAPVAAEAGCPIVLMHSRGTPADMQHHSRYDDVVAEVSAELRSAAGRARAAGIAEEHIVIDPGLGFAKDASQSLALLHGLDALVDLGYPVLVGASRKSFIGHVTGDPPDERMAGSLATVAWAAHHGAAIVRVHDVRETSRFLAVWAAVAQGGDST